MSRAGLSATRCGDANRSCSRRSRTPTGAEVAGRAVGSGDDAVDGTPQLERNRRLGEEDEDEGELPARPAAHAAAAATTSAERKRVSLRAGAGSRSVGAAPHVVSASG